MVDHFLAEGAKKVKIEARPIALIAPHAGYVYSGRCAGIGYATVRGKAYARVVVLAVNHRGMPFRGASILGVDAYKTPLGTVPVDREACEALLKSRLFGTRRSAHRMEHSLEIQLPFLQRAISDFKLVPIVCGNLDGDQFAAMAAELRKVVDDDTLVVASTDFTHYGSRFRYVPFTTRIRQNLEKLDKGAIDFILKRDGGGFWRYVQRTGATICGRIPVRLLLHMLPEKASGQLLNYYTSGDATGDYRNSVSYAAVAFTAPGQWGRPAAKRAEGSAPTIASAPARQDKPAAKGGKPSGATGVSKAGQRKLLEIARKTLVAVTAGKPIPELKLSAPELQSRNGVFVTLNKDGKLRGCIGNFRPTTPLYRTVAAQTRLSALRDRRFSPVQPGEVADIDIEISILLPARAIKKPLDWQLGRHGIIVRRGYRQATFLPQVGEHFRSANLTERQSQEAMLAACCRKARLPAYIWRDPETTILIYEAQVFGEKEAKQEK